MSESLVASSLFQQRSPGCQAAAVCTLCTVMKGTVMWQRQKSTLPLPRACNPALSKKQKWKRGLKTWNSTLTKRSWSKIQEQWDLLFYPHNYLDVQAPPGPLVGVLLISWQSGTVSARGSSQGTQLLRKSVDKEGQKLHLQHWKCPGGLSESLISWKTLLFSNKRRKPHIVVLNKMNFICTKLRKFVLFNEKTTPPH